MRAGLAAALWTVAIPVAGILALVLILAASLGDAVSLGATLIRQRLSGLGFLVVMLASSAAAVYGITKTLLVVLP